MFFFTGGLDVPIERPFVKRDWRFGKYQFDGLQDPSCLMRFLGFMFFGWPRAYRINVPYISELEGESESEPEFESEPELELQFG